jgi:hypothetical protein
MDTHSISRVTRTRTRMGTVLTGTGTGLSVFHPRVTRVMPYLLVLEKLIFRFDSPQCCPDQKSQRPPLPTCTLLPVFTTFHFKGVSKYLPVEDLMAQIDAPLLNDLEITFFHQLVFDTP